MGLPVSRYWPRLTMRMPSRPANGARMVFFSIVARMASALALFCFKRGLGGIQLGLRDHVLAAQVCVRGRR